MHESENWKWKWSRVWLFATPWTTVYQAPPSMGFSRQEYWSGVPLPSPLLTTTCTVFHSWLMVTTSCSQMLHQHLMYTHCDFLQNKKGSAHIQIAEEWGCYSSRLPFPFDFLDSVLTPLSRYPLQKTFFVSSPTSCQDPSMSYSWASPSYNMSLW